MELAISDVPITKLEQGLNGRYMVGYNCKDPHVCDFAKAFPHIDYSLSGQSPAETFFLR